MRSTTTQWNVRYITTGMLLDVIGANTLKQAKALFVQAHPIYRGSGLLDLTFEVR